MLSLAACGEQSWPPEVQPAPDKSPVLSPAKALESFYLPPGYDIQLVASEPLVVDPVAMDFDAQGRLWVAEMRSYMPNVEGEGEKKPTGKIVVLEDTSGNGRMDKRTVYLDSLILPRAVKALDHGVLVGAPPNLWMTEDTTGDLKADAIHKIRSDFGDLSVNPESNPNGLMWGIDNWIHTTHYDGRFQLRDGQLHYDKTPSLGQWGITKDSYGRIYRNSNSNPMAVDYISSHYYSRNKDLDQQRGLYESIYKNKTVWPVRPTTGINRGYREGMLRDDSTLTRYTSASALAVYRGDKLPGELRGDVFVPEPAGNLVQRYVLKKQRDGSLIGHNPYEDLKADFLTSTDERFRPVNIYTAPDGTLYILDMYRGIIQNQLFLTNYLKTEIEKRGLEKPIGLGRIYRIIHDSTIPGPTPDLSSKSPEELASYLNHPNGWWRDTAQRLLVERQADSVVPKLRQLATDSEKDYARLHALWTLNGLDAINDDLLDAALSDSSPHLRAAAIRIAEAEFSSHTDSYHQKLISLLDDSAHVVQRQLAASIGELPSPERSAALMKMVKAHGNDPIVVNLVLSGLGNQEFSFLSGLLDQFPDQQIASKTIERLTRAVLNSGSGNHISSLLNRIGDQQKPVWQRRSLLAGLEEVAPEPSSGGSPRLFELDNKPIALLDATSETGDPLARRIDKMIKRLDWPGKPKAEPTPEPLTPDEKERFELGKQLFATSCGSCHQEDGKGMKGMAPPLVNSKWVLGKPSHLIRILLDGKEGEMRMPPVGDRYSDEEIAAIATYIRQAWGHKEHPVPPSLVMEVRGASTGRDHPWTDEELNSHRH
ncbi:DUF7133 domain-containing protein [Fodinibius sediminis]|nr:c-type cytochrome [Fodinibius sediminis]